MTKRKLAETLLYLASMLSRVWHRKPKGKPDSFFILRNNGLGDLLCATPLFQMLRQNFPDARIVAGIGSWHQDLLDNDPHLTECLTVNAPWHNQFKVSSNFLGMLAYIFFSQEARSLARKKFDVGIDVVGSIWGSLLLIRCGIPLRVGVKGYAGGHSATQLFLDYDPNKHVSQACLEMGRLLQINNMPEPKPQIFLSAEESVFGDSAWQEGSQAKRIVMAPGGSFEEKCWGDENFSKLLNLILQHTEHQIRIIGGKDDMARIGIADLPRKFSHRCLDLSGKLSLRQSAGLVSSCDFVISNSSVAMHFAGAFSRPSLILLGEWYESAKLHHRQWGYPESTVIGKECRCGKNSIPDANEAFEIFQQLS